MVVPLVLLLTLALIAPIQHPETLSLLEEPLYAPPVPKADRARLEGEIAAARGDVARDPSSQEAVLRLARAQRDLGRIGDALETLTRAIEGKADAPALRLERARGLIVIRKFELAQRELRKVAETLPEARCDIAFTLYLLAEYKQSHDEYAACKEPGMFGYLAAQRSGAAAGPRPAPPADSERRQPDITLPGTVSSKPKAAAPSIAASYMDAVDRLVADHKPEAKDLLKQIVEKNKKMWMEPVYVAAEADYSRIVKAEPKRKKKKKT